MKHITEASDDELRERIGIALYGQPYVEAHADPAMWDFLVAEQPRCRKCHYRIDHQGADNA